MPVSIAGYLTDMAGMEGFEFTILLSPNKFVEGNSYSEVHWTSSPTDHCMIGPSKHFSTANYKTAQKGGTIFSWDSCS